jgi:phage FluMu protein Com
MSRPPTKDRVVEFEMARIRCAFCNKQISRKILTDAEAVFCPKCKSLISIRGQSVVSTVTRQSSITVRAFRPNKLILTLHHTHPDYKNTRLSVPPYVNLICLKCQKVFTDQYLKRDFLSYLYMNYRGKYKKRLKERLSYREFAVVHLLKECKGKRHHKVARLHRITLFKHIDIREGRKGTAKNGLKQRIDDNIELQIIPEHVTESWVPMTLDEDQVHVKLYCTDGGSGITFDGDSEHSIFHKGGTCFLGPKGWEVNPIETMDEADFDKVWDGLVNYHPLKWVA